MIARKRLMKEENLNGKLRQKVKGGPYYYRLMVANGLRLGILTILDLPVSPAGRFFSFDLFHLR